MNFNNKENGGEKKLLLPNQIINILYPNVENMVVVPNHKRTGNYYENPGLSHFTDKL